MMMASGLLWYDDDTHRPLAAKVAEAAQRYRERVGYEPTTCQLNPKLMPISVSTARKRNGVTRVPEIMLRLEPNEHLRPNYFYVGVLEGERFRKAKAAPATAHPIAKAPKAAAKPAAKARKIEIAAESATLHTPESVAGMPKPLKESASVASSVASAVPTELPKKKSAAKSAKDVATTISTPKVEEKQNKRRTRIAAKAQVKQLPTAAEVTPVARSAKAKQTKTVTPPAPQAPDVVPAAKRRSVKATAKRTVAPLLPEQPAKPKQPEASTPPKPGKKTDKVNASSIQPLSLWDVTAPVATVTPPTPKRAAKSTAARLTSVKKTGTNGAKAPAPASEHRVADRRTA